jgi:FSR family fosmidomycin resistance protein-like MFS transporter
MRYRSIGLLSAGHMFTDLNQGAIPALLPFFISQHHLSYAAAASIVFAANVASSVIQPLFGHWADRSRKSWLMPCGILLAGLGIALTGITSNFALILLLVAVSGVGIAAFHPEAARYANNLASENKAMGLSIFAIGGNVGFAVGPVLATSALLAWGINGTLVLAVPAIAMALFIYQQFKSFSPATLVQKDSTANHSEGKDQWGAFLRLTGIVIARSVIFFGLNTFIPLYWINILHESAALGGTALTIMFSTGVAGTLLGGRVADSLGYRNLIIVGFGALLPLLVALTYIHNTFWATVLLVPISLALFCIYSPIIVSGQNFLPTRVGLASGVTIGLAVSIGGVAAPMLGWIADINGIQAALQSLIVFPVLAIALAFTLPAES